MDLLLVVMVVMLLVLFGAFCDYWYVCQHSSDQYHCYVLSIVFIILVPPLRSSLLLPWVRRNEVMIVIRLLSPPSVPLVVLVLILHCISKPSSLQTRKGSRDLRQERNPGGFRISDSGDGDVVLLSGNIGFRVEGNVGIWV